MSPKLDLFHRDVDDLSDPPTVGEIVNDILCSKPVAGAFGAIGVAGCAVSTGSLRHHYTGNAKWVPALHHGVLRGESTAQLSSDAFYLPQIFARPKRHASRLAALGFLDSHPGSSSKAAKPRHLLNGERDDPTSFLKGGAQSLKGGAQDKTREEEDVIQGALDAEAEAEEAEVTVKEAVETAEDAAEGSVSAAEVAIWTESIAAMGTIAGIATSWFAWKMHDNFLPESLQVPDVGNQLPPELLRPPPDRRVSVCFRPSVTAWQTQGAESEPAKPPATPSAAVTSGSGDPSSSSGKGDGKGRADRGRGARGSMEATQA